MSSTVILLPQCRHGEPLPGHVLTLTAPVRTTRAGMAPVEWMNANDRDHYKKAMSKRVEWRKAGLDLARVALKLGMPRYERAEIWVYVWRRDDRERRYDPANWYPSAKSAVDGFVEAGLLPDDDRRHVRGPFMEHGGILTPRPGAPVGQLVFHLSPWEGPSLCRPSGK